MNVARQTDNRGIDIPALTERSPQSNAKLIILDNFRSKSVRNRVGVIERHLSRLTVSKFQRYSQCFQLSHPLTKLNAVEPSRLLHAVAWKGKHGTSSVTQCN